MASKTTAVHMDVRLNTLLMLGWTRRCLRLQGTKEQPHVTPRCLCVACATNKHQPHLTLSFEMHHKTTTVYCCPNQHNLIGRLALSLQSTTPGIPGRLLPLGQPLESPSLPLSAAVVHLSLWLLEGARVLARREVFLEHELVQLGRVSGHLFG